MVVNKLTVIPESLNNISQPPRALYFCGSNLASFSSSPKVAIVGSRKATTYGRLVTERFASTLARNGVVIISGLALGIDTYALNAAIEAGGRTIAVLPTPITSIAPISNRRLANSIVATNGMLLSEYAADTPAHKYHFVERNRLMSGLADIILITEAAKGSGSLHTATFALDQGKDIAAIPGNITSVQSEGTNELIKSGAIPVTKPEEILELLHVDISFKNNISLHPGAEGKLISKLGAKSLATNILHAESGMPAAEFNKILVKLELEGTIKKIGTDHWRLA